jgi:hypothetical protein
MVLPGCIAPKINHDASDWDSLTMMWLSTFGECCFPLSHKWTFEFGWIQCFESSMRSHITIISVTSSCTDRTQFTFHMFLFAKHIHKMIVFLGGWVTLKFSPVTPKFSPVTPKFSPVMVWSRSGHGHPCLICVFSIQTIWYPYLP